MPLLSAIKKGFIFIKLNVVACFLKITKYSFFALRSIQVFWHLQTCYCLEKNIIKFQKIVFVKFSSNFEYLYKISSLAISRHFTEKHLKPLLFQNKLTCPKSNEYKINHS